MTFIFEDWKQFSLSWRESREGDAMFKLLNYFTHHRPLPPSNICPSIVRNFQPFLFVTIFTAPAVRV